MSMASAPGARASTAAGTAEEAPHRTHGADVGSLLPIQHADESIGQAVQAAHEGKAADRAGGQPLQAMLQPRLHQQPQEIDGGDQEERTGRVLQLRIAEEWIAQGREEPTHDAGRPQLRLDAVEASTAEGHDSVGRAWSPAYCGCCMPAGKH
jgi:hypothetical protein